jgi:hypothetical protein
MKREEYRDIINRTQLLRECCESLKLSSVTRNYTVRKLFQRQEAEHSEVFNATRDFSVIVPHYMCL